MISLNSPTPHRQYPKLGGDLVYGCKRLAQGLDAVGAIAVLYRGTNEHTEIGMSFAPELEIDATVFRQLTDAILNNTYSASITRPHGACLMLAEATDADCVVLFLIKRDGAVNIIVSQPSSNEFVAAFALKIAQSFDSRN